MRDKYWKQVFFLAEQRAWEDLCLLVEKNRWLASEAISSSMLPEYLADDKEYGLLRLLANVADIPVEVIRRLIALGARDKNGRCYLVRLLAGGDGGEEQSDNHQAMAESPLIAAELLKSAERPFQVIRQMQRTLEQGTNDSNPERRALAERCLERSQLFFELIELLQEWGGEDRLSDCLSSEELLLQLQDPDNRRWETVSRTLGGCAVRSTVADA